MKYTLLLSIIVLWIATSAYLLMWEKNPSNQANPVYTTKENPEEIPKIYALWDSLTAGYQLPLDESYPAQLQVLLETKWYAYEVVNAGKSGDTSAWLLARVDWLIEESSPNDIAILVIWANDGMQSLSLDELEVNLEKTIDLLQSRWLEVVLGGMQIPTNLDPRYREDFTRMYAWIADAYDISLIPFFLENVAAIPELNLSDGIHPNATWYAIISQQTLDHLENYMIVTK
jgi:acyl-CoA thioesterase-1